MHPPHQPRNETPPRVDSTSAASAGPEGRSVATESRQLVDHFFRHEYAKLVATLTRRFGVRHWELMEDVAQGALQRALSSWSLQGIPTRPSAWLYRVATNLAVDTLRRDTRWNPLEAASSTDGGEPSNADADSSHEWNETQLHDDVLRMIFVCCDPRVPPESQVALALKTLCGFSSQEISRALLTTEGSIKKRITRAKQKLRELGLEPSSLDDKMLRTRLPDVQAVIYLLFNEGYSSTQQDKLIREDLCEEAVRLAWILAEHPLTSEPRAAALLALLLFHAARLDARVDENGALLLLKEQDRKQWDSDVLRMGFYWFQRANSGNEVTRYHAEAWIAAEHCRAPSVDETNWERIAQGYDLLCEISPSPVHEMNRAIAIGHRDGPDAGLAAFNAIDGEQLSKEYHLWHATRAELARQTNDMETAREALQTAWRLAPTQMEKELICRKLDGLP